MIGAGLAVAAAGFAVLSQVSGDGLAVVVSGLTLAFVGLLPVSTLGVDIVVGAAPPERAGAASAISETTQELGLALGIAILGSIATAVYHGRLADAVPADVAPAAAGAARDTLGGATGAADELPAALLATAGEAFTAGLQTAAVIGAVTLAGAAVVAAIVLRGVRSGSRPEKPLGPDPDRPSAARAEIDKSPCPVATG